MSKKKTTNVNEAEVKSVETEQEEVKEEPVQTEVAAVNVEDTNNNAPKAKGKKTPSKAEQGKKKEGFFKRLGAWFRSLFSELKKVTWLTFPKFLGNTVRTFLFIAIFVALLFGIWLLTKTLLPVGCSCLAHKPRRFHVRHQGLARRP